MIRNASFSAFYALKTPTFEVLEFVYYAVAIINQKTNSMNTLKRFFNWYIKQYSLLYEPMAKYGAPIMM